jgi:zinc transporter ZupT
VSWNFSSLKVIKTAGWIILLADSLHNFAGSLNQLLFYNYYTLIGYLNIFQSYKDGIVIGTSFSKSLNLGVSTSIAIFCYRIPTQLTNYTLLINAGFSHLQALVFNLLSTSGCLIGFFVSISLSLDPSICIWIFTLVTGMFIYMALIEMVRIFSLLYI